MNSGLDQTKNRQHIPLVEKYRPTDFEDIVLDPLNKKILENIIIFNYFPNLLFYGPPGTGKTTTIINLINKYQQKTGILNKDLIIHLNASDDRGVDIIRNQINFFVNSKPLFNSGMKFVILDEVDYMTKNAQQALRYLLQNYSTNVRFCLICNYISKIDDGLQNEFIRLRFNQLPLPNIISFLKSISICEKIKLTDNNLKQIQTVYKSDIRSMINFIQSNQNVIEQNNYANTNLNLNLNILNNNVWEALMIKIRNNDAKINTYIYEISITYNIDKKTIVKQFLNYIIRNHTKYVSSDFLRFVENIIHTQTQNDIMIYYLTSKLFSFLS